MVCWTVPYCWAYVTDGTVIGWATWFPISSWKIFNSCSLSSRRRSFSNLICSIWNACSFSSLNSSRFLFLKEEIYLIYHMHGQLHLLSMLWWKWQFCTASFLYTLSLLPDLPLIVNVHDVWSKSKVPFKFIFCHSFELFHNNLNAFLHKFFFFSSMASITMLVNFSLLVKFSFLVNLSFLVIFSFLAIYRLFAWSLVLAKFCVY